MNASYDETFMMNCSEGCTLNFIAGKISFTPIVMQSQNTLWLLFCSFLIVSMQLGFAMLEVGSVREAHRMTVLAKNVLDSAVSMLAFWVTCEWTHPKVIMDSNGQPQNHLIFYYWTFCATTVTICSGAMAERTHMTPYLCFAVVMSMSIFPEIVAGAWGNEGVLRSEFNEKFHEGYKYNDFAGSGIVHITGGCAALVGNALLGRRITQRSPVEDEVKPAQTEDNMYPLNCWPRRFDYAEVDKHEFETSNYLQVMGMFTLWVGWYGFNAGSTLSTDLSGSLHASIIVMNTTFAAGAGGLGAYLYCYLVKQHIHLFIICNGVIGGLIAITAACAVATRLTSLLIGLCVGLFVYPVLSHIVQRLRLDDPVDAIPVHLGCGLAGVLVVPLCRPDCAHLKAIREPNYQMLDSQARFCEDDFQMSKQFLAQAWGAFTIIWFTVSISFILWGLFGLSECAVAVEDQRLQAVYEILLKIALSDGQQDPDPNLAKRVQMCQSAKRILEKYGWEGGQFKNVDSNNPSHWMKICRQIKLEQDTNFKTALEITGWSSFKYLAQILHRISWTRCVSFRLRIVPAAELSGLGATDVDGGGILKKVQKLIQSMDKEKSKMKNEALEEEVREINALVYGQEALLRTLARQPPEKQPPQAEQSATSSVPRTSDIEGGILRENTGGSSQRTGGSSQRNRQFTQSHSSGSHRSHPNSNSRSTVSDRSAGAISVNSDLDTPPPSVLGQRPRYGARPMSSSRQDMAMSQVVQQLASVLEGQNQMLTALRGSSN